MKRRDFLYASGIVTYAMAASGLDRLKTFLKGSKERTGPVPGKNAFVRDGKSLVSVVHGKDIRRALKEALALIGGADRIGIRGKSVLVKPNVVGNNPNPTTTNPSVVHEIVRIAYEEGASRVFVGDMSALISRGSTKKNMEKTGIRDAAVRAGAEVVYFEDHDWIKVDLPGGKYIKKVDVSEWIYKVDRTINVPVIKTHKYATYSICLKNFIGATNYKQRPYFVDRDHWEEVVSEINIAYTPDLNIVDGTKVMISGGPWEGQEREAGLVMASGDRIAADVTGLGIIMALGGSITGNAWDQRQIIRAAEAGLGAKNSKEMHLLSSSLDSSKEFEILMGKVRKEIS